MPHQDPDTPLGSSHPIETLATPSGPLPPNLDPRHQLYIFWVLNICYGISLHFLLMPHQDPHHPL